MKIGLFELCVGTILVALLLVPFFMHSNDQESPKNIVLVEGDNSWDVFVGGTRTTWNLEYKNYDELPVKNSDYGSTVEYKGKKYTLWRVYSNQIQVSKEVTETK